MKQLLFVLCVLAALLCAVFALREKQAAEQARRRADAEQQNYEAMAAEAAQQEKTASQLQHQLSRSHSDLEETLAQTQELKTQLAAGQSAQKPKFNDLFHDPEMAQMLRIEAREGSAKHVKALLASGLAEQLHLDPSQTAALRDLLARKGSIVFEQFLIPLTTGELKDADIAAAGRATKQALAASDANIQTLLGENGFKTYKWYEQTEEDRGRLHQAQQAFGDASQTLTAELEQQLLAVMIEERANFKFKDDALDDPARMDLEHWGSFMTEQKIESHFEDMTQLNQQILQRMQALLTPDQFDILRNSFTLQLQRGRFVARSTLAMMSR